MIIVQHAATLSLPVKANRWIRSTTKTCVKRSSPKDLHDTIWHGLGLVNQVRTFLAAVLVQEQ